MVNTIQRGTGGVGRHVVGPKLAQVAIGGDNSTFAVARDLTEISANDVLAHFGSAPSCELIAIDE